MIFLSPIVIAFADVNKFTCGTKVFANGERILVIDLLGYHFIFGCLLGAKSRRTASEENRLFRLRTLPTPLEETTIELLDMSPSESLSSREVIIETTLEFGADVLPDDETLIGVELSDAYSDSSLLPGLHDNSILFLA